MVELTLDRPLVSAWDQDGASFSFFLVGPCRRLICDTQKATLKFEGARVQVYRAGGGDQGATRECNRVQTYYQSVRKYKNLLLSINVYKFIIFRDRLVYCFTCMCVWD